MSEIYSTGERVAVFLVIFLVSFVGSMIYLCFRIDQKKTSTGIFILSLIYATCFIFLNIIAMFDLVFNNVQGFEKFTKFIKNYYFVFTIVDKILGFVVFTELIYYLESGHYSTRDKLLDGLYRICYSIKKIPKCEKIIIACVAIPLIGGILTILIIYKKHFDLNKPWDFIFIFFDCYGIFEIYTFVGFFMVQIFSDCRRQGNNKLTERYYRYSVIKIIEKTEKYTNKINDAYIALECEINKNNKTNSQEYDNYLNKTFQDVQEIMNFYKINVNYENFDRDNTNMDLSFPTEEFIHLEKNNFATNNLGKKETRDQNVLVKDNERIKQRIKEKGLAIYIRKYKKAVRRIEKLNKLYIELGLEEEHDLKKINEINEQNKNNKKKKSYFRWYYIIFLLAFIVIVVTDIILPFIINSSDNLIDSNDKYEKESSGFGLIVGVFLSIPIAVLCSSYTVAKIFSATRRRYITGDFLYDKQINDHISLMKTLKLVCGYSFALLYCNLYLWKAIDKKGTFGRPKYYDKVIIPDYTIKKSITVYMIVKIVIIIASIIASLKFNKVFIFKNDLAEYNLNGSAYDDESYFNSFKKEKANIVSILKKNNKIKL